jgi:hypothetical protein
MIIDSKWQRNRYGPTKTEVQTQELGLDTRLDKQKEDNIRFHSYDKDVRTRKDVSQGLECDSRNGS